MRQGIKELHSSLRRRCASCGASPEKTKACVRMAGNSQAALADGPPLGFMVCLLLWQLLACNRCRMVWYCCVEHQKKDWRTHKKTCAMLGAAREDDVFEEKEGGNTTMCVSFLFLLWRSLSAFWGEP